MAPQKPKLPRSSPVKTYIMPTAPHCQDAWQSSNWCGAGDILPEAKAHQTPPPETICGPTQQCGIVGWNTADKGLSRSGTTGTAYPGVLLPWLDSVYQTRSTRTTAEPGKQLSSGFRDSSIRPDDAETAEEEDSVRQKIRQRVKPLSNNTGGLIHGEYGRQAFDSFTTSSPVETTPWPAKNVRLICPATMVVTPPAGELTGISCPPASVSHDRLFG